MTVSLSQSSYVVSEEDGEVTLQLVKSGETELPVEVLLSTVTGTASGRDNRTTDTTQCSLILRVNSHIVQIHCLDKTTYM